MQDDNNAPQEMSESFPQPSGEQQNQPTNQASGIAPPHEKKSKTRAVTTLVIIAVVGSAFVVFQINRKGAVQQEPTSTYLGPSNEQKTPTAPLRFTISPTTPWREYQGKIFPYVFSYPETLSLVVFTNDPTDSVAVSWGNIPPQLNVMLQIDDVAKNPTMRQYLGNPREYVNNWWRQYSGLQDISSVTEFTNAKRLRGYRAKFVNYAGVAQNDNVFFAIPNRQDLMVMFANGVLDPSVFDRVLDSFDWKQPIVTPTPAFVPSSPTPLP
jgi:hypothetical protein